MCLQQFPENTNVRFSTDVFGHRVPCSETGVRESTLSKFPNSPNALQNWSSSVQFSSIICGARILRPKQSRHAGLVRLMEQKCLQLKGGIVGGNKDGSWTDGGGEFQLTDRADQQYVPLGAGHTGWPKKVSHYEVSSLNRIKNRH